MPSTARRRSPLGLALPLVLALLPSGCAPRWAPRTARPEAALQWPHAPQRAKLTYVESLTGFRRGQGAGATLRAVAIGSPAEDPDSFVLPVAVARGRDGRLAVADPGRRCVHLYVPAEQRYVQLTGSAQAPIVSPVAVVFDDELRLFVSDSAGRVYAFAADGSPLFTLQSAGTEPLLRPTGLAYSPGAKRVYVVDTQAARVHAFGQRGQHEFSFGSRGGAAGQFNFPTHAFRTAAGELYVTDSLNFRVQIFDERGRVLGAFGRHGDGSGDLALPKGLAVDADGVVYVVDGLFDHVQLFSRQGDFLLTLGGRGVDFGEFWLPSGAFISETGELYVCDTYNRRIQVFRITAQYTAP